MGARPTIRFPSIKTGQDEGVSYVPPARKERRVSFDVPSLSVFPDVYGG